MDAANNAPKLSLDKTYAKETEDVDVAQNNLLQPSETLYFPETEKRNLLKLFLACPVSDRSPPTNDVLLLRQRS